MNSKGVARLFTEAMKTETAYKLKLEDNAQLHFGTGAGVGVSNNGDIYVGWDGTDLDILQTTANSSIKLGVAGAGIDVVMYGDTSGVSMTWDQSADALVFAGAPDITLAANTAAALEIKDGTTAILAIDTRNTVKDVHGVTISSPATTVATEAAAHVNASLRIAAKTITYTGTTGTTSSLGCQLSIAAPTFTDASTATLTTASSVHVTAVAAAGGMLTITNSRMISTSVSDCYLTNAGVWTDTACWASGKKHIGRGVKKARKAIERVIDKIQPATWKYKKTTALDAIDEQGNPTIHRTSIDDRDRERVGIIYDDLPEELRAPGEERGVATGVLSSFALAALKLLFDENRELKGRLERLEAVA